MDENLRGSALEALVAPIKPQQFLKNYWGKDFVVCDGPSDRFSPLFSWHALSGILSTNRFEFPRLRLLAGGRVIPPEEYIVRRVDRRGNPFVTHDAERVGKLLNQGAMLHITSIGEAWKPLATFSSQLERQLGGKVQVNLHAGYAGSRGFHTHWDGHDVYAAQIDGCKRWRLFGFTEQAPLAVPPEAKQGAPEQHVWEATLGAGQLLYVPRGYWHATQFEDAPSLHLTFAVQHPIGLDFFQWLLTEMATEPALRRDIPVAFLAEGSSARQSAATEYVSAMRDIVSRLISPEFMERYLAEYRSALGEVNHTQLTPETRCSHAEQ